MSNSSGKIVIKTPPVLTRKQKALREAFQSAKSAEEMLKRFKKMEPIFPESELGIECLVLSNRFHAQGGSQHQVLSFGQRALRILLRNNDDQIPCVKRYWGFLFGSDEPCSHQHKPAFVIACICKYLGAASAQLKRFDEGLSYLNWAIRNLTLLENDREENSRCTGDCVLHMLETIHFELVRVKIAVGKRDEIVVHTKKILEIKEKTVEEGSVELGQANRIVADPYFITGMYQESLPYYLKALDIFVKLGVEEEIAHVRKKLGVVYVELGEHDKALEQARLSMNGQAAEVKVANMLVELGRNEEGIEAFESLLLRAETEGNNEVSVCLFVGMARGFCNLGRFSDAKKYMKMAARVLEKKQMSPDVVATAFDDMSRMYEKMGEYESAISCLRRAMAIPQENLANRFGRLFNLISLTGNFRKGIPYLKEAVKRLKKKFGEKHHEVGFGYISLGLSYKQLDELETAAEFLVRGKDVFDVSLGPYHLESLKTSQTLSTIYAEMDSYKQAIENQEKVVRGFKVLGPSEQKLLDGAVILLKELKELAACEDTELSPARNSESDVSRVGKAVLSIAEIEGNQEARVVSLMCKARGFYKEHKVFSAKKCIEIAEKIFDKEDIGPLVRATAFEDMSKVYKVMGDSGTAISYLHKALVIPELPQDHRMDSCSRLFSLISSTGEEEKTISCLEEAVERLKDKFGPNHVKVGYGYTNLGTAYMNSDKAESAVKFLEYAKNILDVSLGPHHFDSLKTSQSLSINYANMRRFDQALEIQEKVIVGLKGLGQSEKEFQDEAVRLLNQMKEMSIDEVAESQEHA